MRLLLDTHVWLWAIAESGRLSAPARSLISDEDNEILVSAITVAEIGIKFRIGKLRLPAQPRVFIPEALELDSFGVLPFAAAHALKLADLELHHRDPFDRMLIAQAIVEDVAVITADPIFKRYDIKVIRA